MGFLLVQYLRILAGAYEKTQELAKELHNIGCGDLDVEGIVFKPFKTCVFAFDCDFYEVVSGVS